MTGAGRRALPLYVGGFLGPFGGSVVAVLLPELQVAFGASTSAVALAAPAYLVPFAVVQLVSGTIGERLGRRRVVRAAYLVYALASIAGGLAPTLPLFLAARALQGLGNAFTTPLLLAGLADVTPAARLGRSVGTFAAVQAAGITFAPLLGGLAGDVNWRLAFIAPALVALVLMLVPPPDGRYRPGARPAFRDLATRRMGLLCGAGFLGYGSLTGLSYLVSVYLDQAFGVNATVRGVMLAAFGAAGALLGRPAGRLADRVGPVRAAMLAAGCAAPALALLGAAPGLGPFALLWMAAGACSALLWAALNTETIEAVPDNRGGAVSLVAACKFAGTGLAPFVWLPLAAAVGGWAFVGAGLATLAIVPLAAALRRVPGPAA